MLYDGVDEVDNHAQDLATRIEKIAKALGKTIYAYNQDDFLSKAKKLQFPAIGIFYGGLASAGGTRSNSGSIKFDLIIVDDVGGAGGCSSDGGTLTATTLLSLIRQELYERDIEGEKQWSFKSEVPFDLGDKNKIAYVQSWVAIVCKA